MLRLGVIVAVAVVAGAGCSFYRAPVLPPLGSGFTQISAPMNLRLRATEVGPKRGRAESVSIIGLFSFGDASIAEAARNGNITTVKHADTECLNVLGLYIQHKTCVYGE